MRFSIVTNAKDFCWHCLDYIHARQCPKGHPLVYKIIQKKDFIVEGKIDADRNKYQGKSGDEIIKGSFERYRVVKRFLLQHGTFGFV